MKKFFLNLPAQLRDGRSYTLTALSGVVVLVVAVVFISTGGLARVTHVLAVSGVLPQSLTGCVFPCNNTAYTMEALIPESSQGVAASSFLTGQTIRFQWNAGSYGANNFARVCQGANGGPSWVCTVQQGSPNTNFNACSPRQCVACLPGWADEFGGCPNAGCVWAGPSNCGNADDYYGNTCFGSSGGTSPSCPGYDGNWNDAGWGNQSSYFTAPSTPGTYTYYFCSNWLMHASQGPLSCIGTNVTVVQGCTTSGFSSPWGSNSYLISSGGEGTISNWYGRYCVHNYNSNTVYIPMATQTEWNNFSAAASAISVTVRAY